MTILLIALAIVGFAFIYQIGKFITRPWRTLPIPKGVTFELRHINRLEKSVRLYFNGEYQHKHPVSYEGDPVRNMRKAQCILLKRFKATRTCQQYIPTKSS